MKYFISSSFKINQFMLKCLLLFICLICLSSCSITKRKYLSGYMVNWGSKNISLNKKTAEISNNKEIIHLIKSRNGNSNNPNTKNKYSFQDSVISFLGATFNNKSSVLFPNIYTSQLNNKLIERGRESILLGSTKKEGSNTRPYTEPTTIKSEELQKIKTAPIATISLCLGIAALTLWFIAVYIISLFWSTSTTPSMFQPVLIIQVICGILSISLGVNAFRFINKHKDKYSGTWLAIIGMLLSILGIIFVFKNYSTF